MIVLNLFKLKLLKKQVNRNKHLVIPTKLNKHESGPL